MRKANNKDEKKGLCRIEKAHISNEKNLNKVNNKEIGSPYKDNVIAMPIYQAINRERQKVSLSDAEGYISAEFLYLYPPGIPFLVPGEIISREVIDDVQIYQDMGLSVEGLSDFSLQAINVVPLK